MSSKALQAARCVRTKVSELLLRVVAGENGDSFFRNNKVPPLVKADIPEDEAWALLPNASQDVVVDDTVERNPLAHTQRVSFELSNLCNYSHLHKKCPLSIAREPEILPSSVVFDTLDFLGEEGFSGRISFHNYNEPLTDPRLFNFIARARRNCPVSDVYICTNGYHLTQELADELVACGVSNFHVSGYSRSEIARLDKIKVDVPYKVVPMKLDDTMNAYERSFTGCMNPCFAPLNEIIITSDARMSLCCLDWRRKYCFGDLTRRSLKEVIVSKEMQFIYSQLSQGKRIFDICQRCDWTR